jgi:hypothetical protein
LRVASSAGVVEASWRSWSVATISTNACPRRNQHKYNTGLVLTDKETSPQRNAGLPERAGDQWPCSCGTVTAVAQVAVLPATSLPW